MSLIHLVGLLLLNIYAKATLVSSGCLLDLFLRDGVVLVVNLAGGQHDAVGHAPLVIRLDGPSC